VVKGVYPFYKYINSIYIKALYFVRDSRRKLRHGRQKNNPHAGTSRGQWQSAMNSGSGADI
jgi:hypothetical protein